MLILNRLQVEALLDVDALIDALASAMADLSAGRASVPDRVAALVPEHGGFLAAHAGFGAVSQGADEQAGLPGFRIPRARGCPLTRR